MGSGFNYRNLHIFYLKVYEEVRSVTGHFTLPFDFVIVLFYELREVFVMSNTYVSGGC